MLSEKNMNDPVTVTVSEEAHGALEIFAKSIGVSIERLISVTTEEQLGRIVDQLTTIGVNAVNK